MKKLVDIDFADPKARLGMLACLALLAALWCWLDYRGLRLQRDSHRSLVSQIERMNADAARIRVLRAAPRLATERERPNDDLLDQVRDAIEHARIPLARWIGNEPSAAVRIPRSPYRRLSTRFSFDGLTMRQLVEFVYQLTELDPSLSIPHVRIHAPASRQGSAWNVDLTLSYLIYSPS